MFYEKMSVLSKTLCSCHFFQVFYEKPPAVKPIYGQKNVKSVKITLFWARKDNRMPFFSDFSWKNNCSNAYILSKNRPFSEKNLLLWPYYVKNTSTVVFVLNTPPLLNTPSLVKSDFQNIASDPLNTPPPR